MKEDRTGKNTQHYNIDDKVVLGIHHHRLWDRNDNRRRSGETSERTPTHIWELEEKREMEKSWLLYRE